MRHQRRRTKTSLTPSSMFTCLRSLEIHVCGSNVCLVWDRLWPYLSFTSRACLMRLLKPLWLISKMWLPAGRSFKKKLINLRTSRFKRRKLLKLQVNLLSLRSVIGLKMNLHLLSQLNRNMLSAWTPWAKTANSLMIKSVSFCKLCNLLDKTGSVPRMPPWLAIVNVRLSNFKKTPLLSKKTTRLSWTTLREVLRSLLPQKPKNTRTTSRENLKLVSTDSSKLPRCSRKERGSNSLLRFRCKM